MQKPLSKAEALDTVRKYIHSYLKESVAVSEALKNLMPSAASNLDVLQSELVKQEWRMTLGDDVIFIDEIKPVLAAISETRQRRV